MDHSTNSIKPLIRQRAVTGHVPGPIEQAAAKVYFERGSKPVLEKNSWKITAIGSVATSFLLVGVIALILPLKTVETIQIGKGADGRLSVQSTDAQKFTVDDDVRAAWVNDWVYDLTEINSATWQRGVARAASRSVGTGVDQVRDYLNQEDNQPASLLAKNPGYVREFRRESVNMLQSNVVLIRYTLTSRPRPGTDKQSKTYAMTVNLSSVKPKTREDAIANPSGLVVQNFNISDESVK